MELADVRKALGDVLNKAVKNYTMKSDKPAVSTIVTGVNGERWLFVIWPGGPLNMHYACAGLPQSDIGECVCGVDMGYINVDGVIEMTTKVITEWTVY